MAKLQKVEKKDKKPGMAPQTKRNLINVFKSLISNQAAIDGAKEAPFWIGIIFLVLSVALPIIPIIVAQQKVAGDQFISSTYNYGADRGLANTTMQLKSEGYIFKVEGGHLVFNKPITDEAVASDIITKQKDSGEEYQVYNFRFYVTTKTGSDLTAFITKLTETAYLEKSTTVYTVDHETAGFKSYKSSFIVVTPDTLAMALYKSETIDQAATSLGGLNWLHTADCANLLDRLDNDTTLVNVARRDNIFKNWRAIFNETYIEQKNVSTRNMALIYMGVYAGLILFLGLMIFLLTRGKNNAFNYLKWYTCQFIAWWAAFTPAVLGMILGFIFASNMIGQMGFIVLVSIRIMWLSMRQLRPIQ